MLRTSNQSRSAGFVRRPSAGWVSALALAATAVPAHAISLGAGSDHGVRAMPVMFDREPAVSWGSQVGTDDGCGPYMGDGTVFLAVPVQGFTSPSPVGETRAFPQIASLPAGTFATFAVRTAPAGAVPRDELDAIGLRLSSDVAPTGTTLSSRSPRGIEGIEVDPYAHLDGPPVRTFPSLADRSVLADGLEVLQRVAYASSGTVAPTGSGAIGPGGFADLSAVRATGVGSDAVAVDGWVDDVAPIALGSDDVAPVWLYPAASSGTLQEIDAKGSIVFTAFRAEVAIDALAPDCGAAVGADIVEAALPTDPGPLLAGLGPLPAGPLGAVGSDTVTSLLRQPPQTFTRTNLGTPPTNGRPPLFIPGGGGGGGGGGGDPTVPDPSPIPLPLGLLLYPSALLALGFGAWIGRRGLRTAEVTA
jgi:hypothetical protein